MLTQLAQALQSGLSSRVQDVVILSQIRTLELSGMHFAAGTSYKPVRKGLLAPSTWFTPRLEGAQPHTYGCLSKPACSGILLSALSVQSDQGTGKAVMSALEPALSTQLGISL